MSHHDLVRQLTGWRQTTTEILYCNAALYAASSCRVSAHSASRQLAYKEASRRVGGRLVQRAPKFWPRMFRSNLLRGAAGADERSASVHDQDLACNVTSLAGQEETHGAANIPAGALALKHGSLAAGLTRLFSHAA